jgi:hypothetical protein
MTEETVRFRMPSGAGGRARLEGWVPNYSRGVSSLHVLATRIDVLGTNRKSPSYGAPHLTPSHR